MSRRTISAHAVRIAGPVVLCARRARLRRHRRSAVPAFAFVGIALAVAVVGVTVTRHGVGRYDRSDRVPFDMSFSLMTSVWIAIGALDAFVGLLAWRSPRRRATIVAWSITMVLQGAWTISLFGARNPGVALVALGFLCAAVVVFAALSHRHQPLAAWLVLPVLSWLSFASLLNLSLAR